MFDKVLTKNMDTPGSYGIDAYEAAGGYISLANVLNGYSPADLI